jgi:outer membrane protein
VPPTDDARAGARPGGAAVTTTSPPCRAALAAAAGVEEPQVISPRIQEQVKSSVQSTHHYVVRVAVALLVASAIPTSLNAQAPEVRAPLTLAAALEIAEARSESVALAQTAIARNEGDFVRAKSGRRPQLSGSATYERSLANEFQGVFDDIDFGGGGSDGQGSLDNLPFGRANTWRATLSFSQTLYAGGRLAAQDALVSVGRRSADQALVGARAQVLFDVTQAYFDAALSGRLVAIAEATFEQADATLRQVQAGFDAGTQPEFEVLRARVNRDNQMPVVIRQRVNRDVALLRLKQLLDLPADADVRLSDALDDERLGPPQPFVEAVAAIESSLPSGNANTFTLQANVALPDRNAVAEAETAVQAREAQLVAVQAERRPSVNLTSNYSRIAFPSAFFPAFERSNWAIAASVTMPFLTGGRQRGDEMVARADVEQARIQLRQIEELSDLDTRSAWAELVAARAAWAATSGTVQQATRAFEIAQVRYQAGLSTRLELSDSRLLSQQAEANRALAARDLQVARARVALLPNLPLGPGGTGGPAGGGRGAVPAPQPAPAPPPQQRQFQNATVQTAGTQTGAR